MGMPSALNFRGMPFVREYAKSSPMTSYIYTKDSNVCSFDYDEDSLEKPSIKGSCPKLWRPDSYLGFSNALIANKGQNWYIVAASAPRENFYGTVRLFKIHSSQTGGENMNEITPLLKGPTRGAYFGYSIAAVDVNGDGLKDLIVGAPYYSEKFEPDKGVVYIYMQTGVNVCFYVMVRLES
jgi:hypothetical protein